MCATKTLSYRFKVFWLVGFCFGCDLSSASGESPKVAMGRAKDASTAEEVLSAIKSAPVNGLTSPLLAMSDFQSAMRLGEGDMALRLAIGRLLTPPLFQKGQQPTHIAAVRKLIATLAAQRNAADRPILQNIYLTSYSGAEDLQQLDNAKQIAKLLHPLMREWGLVQEFEFERSATYKKLVRKQRLLADVKG